MGTEAQVLNLLEAGMNQAQVAAHLNISAGYVSQIANQQDIRTKVLDAHSKLLDEATERDQKYNKIEDKLLDKLEKSISTIYKPQDVLRALVAINKAERRGATSQQIAELANRKNESIVELDLPERVKAKFVRSKSKEIIEVNGRALITQDSRTLYGEMLAIEKKGEDDGNRGLDVELPELLPIERKVGSGTSTEASDGQRSSNAEAPANTKALFDSLFSEDARPN